MGETCPIPRRANILQGTEDPRKETGGSCFSGCPPPHPLPEERANQKHPHQPLSLRTEKAGTFQCFIGPGKVSKFLTAPGCAAEVSERSR